MKTILLLTLILLFAARARCAAETNEQRECVVLLHGFGRTAFSMRPLERVLEREGYQVVNITYPTWRTSVEDVAANHLPKALESRVPGDAARVHFVTFSMGGILLRQYLNTHSVSNLGRVVMLGAPNQGSELADRPARFQFVRWLAGINLSRLGTGPDHLPRRLGPVDYEVGVIAGDKRPFAWPAFKGKPNDGLVAVASAAIEGMKDMILVHTHHTFLVSNSKTKQQVIAFLANGAFQHGQSSEESRTH